MAAIPKTSVQDVVAYGQKIADLFLAWCHMNPRTHLEDMNFFQYVLATSNLLHQFQNLDDVEGSTPIEQSAVKALTQDGHERVEALAVKCDLLYKAIMIILQKAVERDKEPLRKEEINVGNLEVDLLTGPIPDPSSLKSLGMHRRWFNEWDWLEDRLKLCGAQLCWIAQELLLIIQMAKLAQLQISSGEREDGTFEQELMGRAAIRALRIRLVRYTEVVCRELETGQRRRELREKSDCTLDASSVQNSVSSQKSNATSSTDVEDQKSPVVNTELASSRNNADDGASKAVVQENATIPDQKTSPSEGAAETKPMDTAATTTLSKPAKPLFSLNCSTDLNAKLLARMSDWTHRIFGREDHFTNDWASTDLEAYIHQTKWVHNNPTIKVPFGHRRLKYGLEKAMKNDKNVRGLSWDRYIARGPYIHNIINVVVREANRLRNRERVCIAFHEYCGDIDGSSFVLVFFSIKKENQPILYFTDAVGRSYKIPFETCKTWDGMKATIMEAFHHMPVTGSQVVEGHYDILSSDGDIILPKLWSSTIKPGDAVTMRMNPPTYRPPMPFPDPRGVSLPGHQQMYRPPNMGYQPPPPPPPGLRMRPFHDDNMTVSSSSSSSVNDRFDRFAVSEEEHKQLKFIDFVEELEKTKTVTVGDLLTKFTNLKDVLDEDCLDGFWSDVSDDHSETLSSSDGMLRE